MDLVSIRAKGVEPKRSIPALLPGWKLGFNVQHFFRHEGGVANILQTGSSQDSVHGVVHLCDDNALARLDAVEAFGVGYDRVPVTVDTAEGPISALTYVGMEQFINNACRPTQRYLNILVSGATNAGLQPAYIEALRRQPIHVKRDNPAFEPPATPDTTYTATSLAEHPRLTALAGFVFNMMDARWQHQYLIGLFGGKDMTLWHLKRLDTSDGSESIDDIKKDKLSRYQKRYLNEYLLEYNVEYQYAGRFRYE